MGPIGRVVDSISSKLAFFPPTPPTYEVRQHDDNTGALYIHPTVSYLSRVVDCDVFWVNYKHKKKQISSTNRIIATRVPYRHPGGLKRRTLTVLYSHGNAVDLGQSMPFLKELSQRLGCHIVSYDYSGFGQSNGSAQVRNTLMDIKAVFEELKDRYGTHEKELILYGHSIGSGPTIHLAAEIAEFAGVILHSPLLSGIRVINPNLKWWPKWADVYPNHILMPKVKSPTLIMHGSQDEIVDISHGKTLHKLAPNVVDGFFPEQYNHQNLEASPLFFPILTKFVRSVCHGTIT
eukprot:g6103.t1